MASTLPQYAYDPITQTYRLLTPQEQVQVQQQSQVGGLYDLNSGGGDANAAVGAPSSGGFMTDAFGHPTEMGVSFGVGAQNMGNAISSSPLAAFSPTMGVVGAVASNVGNSIMGTQVSPVAAPTTPAETAIGSYGQVSSGLQGLAEAISEADNEQDSNAGMAEAANAAAEAAAAAADAADDADADAGAANAAAAAASGVSDGGVSDGGNDSGGGDSGGPSGDAGVSGAANEGSHGADGNNSGDSGDSDGGDGDGGDGDGGDGDGGWYKGGQIMSYAGGGVANPQGILRYDYDPKTQQYSLVGRENAGGSSGLMGMGGLSPLADLIRQVGLGNERRYDYNPQTQEYTQKMAKGGVASAQHAQSMGRGQDTMLVHMTPGEVGGLQALAKAGGGSLTINPNTGLPEAGFLSAMLPMVAGAALTGLTGGVINPMTASLLVGGGYGLATGSMKKGLMAGLGAFGGANIATGLGASAAAGTAENLAAPVVESSVATPLEVAQSNIDPSLLENMSATDVLNTPTGTQALTAAQSNVDPAFLENMSEARTLANARVLPSTTVTGVPATSPTGFVQGDYMGNLSKMGQGAQNLMASGPQGTAARAAFGENVGYGTLASAAAPILTEEPEPVAKKPGYYRRYNLDVANRSELGSQYAPGSSYERQMVDYSFTPQEPVRYAAEGGVMALAKGGETKKKSKGLAGTQYYKFAQDRRDSSMQGAIDANFAAGGQPRFLSGGGDGMSDDIPATIDGKQPARLADGEFVVPADVVSHLGNGSSKAGAKKLYKMMDRIREARTGKKKQAPEVKTERFMPA